MLTASSSSFSCFPPLARRSTDTRASLAPLFRDLFLRAVVASSLRGAARRVRPGTGEGGPTFADRLLGLLPCALRPRLFARAGRALKRLRRAR